MAGTWEEGRTPVRVWYERGVCVVCCFVLLNRRRRYTGYRGVPQGSPHPNCLRLLPSQATPGPPLPNRPIVTVDLGLTSGFEPSGLDRPGRLPHQQGLCQCCFVLVVPTPEEYRVPRVNPGVTASKLFLPLLPSLTTPGPPLPDRPLRKSRYYYPRFRVGSSICLASSVGCAEGAGGSPCCPWWLRWISCPRGAKIVQ